jgi:hypothetical protein
VFNPVGPPAGFADDTNVTVQCGGTTNAGTGHALSAGARPLSDAGINAIEMSVPVNSSGTPVTEGQQPTGWMLRVDTPPAGRFAVYLQCVAP